MKRWHWAQSKLQDPNYLALPATARGILACIEEMASETGEIRCTLKVLAGWIGSDTKTLRAYLPRIAETSYIAVEQEGNLYTFRCERHSTLRRLPVEGWQKLRDVVFRRDGFKCRYCGEANTLLECDHVVPVSRGGSNELENLVTACKPCNRSKGAKLLTEWRV